jgi:hypothetical protein
MHLGFWNLQPRLLHSVLGAEYVRRATENCGVSHRIVQQHSNSARMIDKMTANVASALQVGNLAVRSMTECCSNNEAVCCYDPPDSIIIIV